MYCNMVLQLCTLFSIAAATKSTPASRPLCCVRMCSGAAQTGFEGYCKKCYKVMSPKKHSQKLAQRSKHCSICSERKELVWALVRKTPSRRLPKKTSVTNSMVQICKPCYRAWKCNDCSAVNPQLCAVICGGCSGAREKLGAAQRRLALWCIYCTVLLLRNGKRICAACVSMLSAGSAISASSRASWILKSRQVFHCAEAMCDQKMRFCRRCAAMVASPGPVLCKTCWHAEGNMRVRCRRPAQNKLNCYRLCRPCLPQFRCSAKDCVAQPPLDTLTTECGMCSRLLCGAHCIALQRR